MVRLVWNEIKAIWPGLALFGVGIFMLWLITALQAHATWKPEYINLPAEVRQWYQAASVTPEAHERLKNIGEKGVFYPHEKCCDYADVVGDATFRYDGHWWYSSPTITDDKWVRLNDDIVHDDGNPPYGVSTLFVFNGLPVCFWPASGG